MIADPVEVRVSGQLRRIPEAHRDGPAQQGDGAIGVDLRPGLRPGNQWSLQSKHGRLGEHARGIVAGIDPTARPVDDLLQGISGLVRAAAGQMDLGAGDRVIPRLTSINGRIGMPFAELAEKTGGAVEGLERLIESAVVAIELRLEPIALHEPLAQQGVLRVRLDERTTEGDRRGKDRPRLLARAECFQGLREGLTAHHQALGVIDDPGVLLDELFIQGHGTPRERQALRKPAVHRVQQGEVVAEQRKQVGVAWDRGVFFDQPFEYVDSGPIGPLGVVKTSRPTEDAGEVVEAVAQIVAVD